MRKKMIMNNWEFEIYQVKGEYGFKVIIYKNNEKIISQGGFGSENNAEFFAENYFLMQEFGIDNGQDE